jgi:DNA-directed RNA polymerase specialized sigma subunit
MDAGFTVLAVLIGVPVLVKLGQCINRLTVQNRESAAQDEEIVRNVMKHPLELLNKEQQACFFLYYFDDNPHSLDDVSKITKIPKTTVSRRLDEELKILRAFVN